jgi:glycylpeptide N-tetradecanoyltransferase
LETLLRVQFLPSTVWTQGALFAHWYGLQGLPLQFAMAIKRPRVFENSFYCVQGFRIAPILTEEEVAHLLLPSPNVVSSYVITAEDGSVTDLCSFYTLPSSIIGNPEHKSLKAAYSFYNVATSVPLEQLMTDALILAKQNDFDVFNALDIQHNESFLKDLKFGPGDGFLHYYLYNWRLNKELQPKDVGLVML